MIDEFTLFARALVKWLPGARVQIDEISLNAKLWQENFTPEQSSRF